MPTKPIRILATGDWIDSGFGTVMRNVFGRLARSKAFEVHLVGWNYRGKIDLAREAIEAGIHLYPTLPLENGIEGREDMTGAITCTRLVQQLRPDIFFFLGDPWQCEPFTRDPFQNVTKVFYVAVDTDVMEANNLKNVLKADVVVTMSEFGRSVMKRQAKFSNPSMIYHGVDPSVFRVMDDTVRDRMRAGQKWKVPEGVDPWVVLVVGTNQTRKAHPRSVAAFKAATCATFNDQEAEIAVDADEEMEAEFADKRDGDKYRFKPAHEWCEKVQKMRCEKCPFYKPDPVTTGWVLHFHCPNYSLLGWNLSELAQRFDLVDRIGCSSFAQDITPQKVAMLMNASDVHLLLTHREGFGLPIVETMACGKPNIVTGYSSCVELIEKGGGHAVKITDFNTNNFHSAVDAMADIADAARALRRAFTDKFWYARQRQKGLDFTAGIDWDKITMQWVELFRESLTRV